MTISAFVQSPRPLPCRALASRLDRVLSSTDLISCVGPDPRLDEIARVLGFPGPIRRLRLLDGTCLALAIVPTGHVLAARALRRAAGALQLRLLLVPEARLVREEAQRLALALTPFTNALPDEAECIRLVTCVAWHGTIPLADLAETVPEPWHPIEGILALVARGRLRLDPTLGISPDALVTLPA